MKLFKRNNQTSSSGSGLPFHRAAKNERAEKSSGPTKQIKFEPNTDPDSWRRVLKRTFYKFTSASTGTPSDGLGGEGSESSASIIAHFHAAARQRNDEKEGSDWELDETIVEQEPSNEHEHEHDSHRHLPTHTNTSEKGTASQVGSLRRNFDRRDSAMSDSGYSSWIRGRVWPYIVAFFNPHFEDPVRELDYQKQEWYTSKSLAFYASLYLYLNWILYLILNHSVTMYEFIVYYGGFTLVTLPIPFLVAFDKPVKRPIIFQTLFVIAVWYCAFSEVIELKVCGFYSDHRHCHGKDFLEMSYYSTGLPAIAMFIVSRRLYNAVAQFVFFILLCTLVIPDQGIYARNVVSFAIFSLFTQGLHYSLEMNSRRIYIVNNQLKIAYRAQQKAQIAESKASHAKKRFASYIFHEVRVPLNTAMLAYQNMQTANAFKDEALVHQNVEVYALEASLTMMQQVLNDALDLEKMDAGRFESSPRPFPLHRAIQSVLGPINVATSSKNLRLVTDLDERIDSFASPFVSSDGLWVVGDEIRLRQVLTNLLSNAIKFTPENGGDIKVVTRLVPPSNGGEQHMSTSASSLHDQSPGSSRQNSDIDGVEGRKRDKIVFRLEIHDSGPGIRPSELVEGRLFQPFVQTNVGKLSGKGSGLGLAIVRQIVALSGGRLGVRSRKGNGAMFWIEFSYPIATVDQIASTINTLTPTSMPPITLEKPMIPPVVSTLESPTSDEPEKLHKFVSFAGTDAPFLPTLPQIDLQSTRPRPRVDQGPITTSSDMPTPPQSTRSLPSVLSPSNSTVLSPAGEGAPDAMNVLVVDDDPMTRTLMTRMLKKLGCVVDTAEDGQQCLDKMLAPDARKYDLISLDNFMPVMTGEETVRKLRSLNRTDLVVGCTGNALSEDQSAYVEAGADRVLTKPIMLKDLKAVLEVARKRRQTSTNETEQPINTTEEDGSAKDTKGEPDQPAPENNGAGYPPAPS